MDKRERVVLDDLRGADEAEIDRVWEQEFTRRSMLARGAFGAVAAAGAVGLVGAGSALAAPARAGASRKAPSTLVTAMAGPVLAINPDGPGQNNLPSVAAWFACYESLTDFALPATFEALKALSKKGVLKPIPKLAKSWTVSPDGKTYTFNLRQGVKSAFGNELTSADVVWSMQKSLAGKATGAFFLLLGNVFTPDQITAVNKYTVRIKIAAPSNRLPLTVGWGWGVIYDSTEVKKHVTAADPWGNEWLNRNAAGFGPYKLSSFAPGGQQLVFDARPDYWGPKPAFKKVIQRGVDNPGSRLQLLLSGSVGYAAELTPIQLDQVKKSKKSVVTRLSDTTSAYLALTLKPPWNDKAIRQAVARAIPYNDILKTALRGQGVRQKSLLAPFVEGYTERFFRYETDLKAAGAVLSKIDKPLTLAYAEGLPVDEQIAILTQSSFKKAGFDLKIEKQPRAQFDQRKYGRTGELEFFVDVLDAPGIPTADYYFFSFAHKNGFFNFYNFDNDTVNKLITALETETDPVKRAKLVVTGQKVLTPYLLIHPIAWTGKSHAHANYLSIPRGHTGNQLLAWQDFRAV